MSKLLQKRWQDRNYKMHQQKLKAMRSTLDTKRPQTFPHLQFRTKKIQLEEERAAEVEMQNRILLEKISQILRSRGRLDNTWEGDLYVPRSLNIGARHKQQQTIETENWEIAKRLGGVKPQYKIREMENSYQQHLYLKGLWEQMTKDYDDELSPRMRRTQRDLSPGQLAGEDDYEDDFESDDDEKKEEKSEKTSDKPAEKTPDKRSESRTSPSHPSSQESPRFKQRSRGPRLPTIHKKLTEETPYTKPARNMPESQAEADARELFRAAKSLVPTLDNVIKHLVRRTHAQRMQIRNRFHDLYELDLCTELRKVMGSDCHPVLEAMLKDKLLHMVIQLERIFMKRLVKSSLVADVLAGRTDVAPAPLKSHYLARSGADLEDDIREHSQPETSRLLLALLNSSVHKLHTKQIDDIQAAADAQKLYEGGAEAWQDEAGVFIRLVTSGNWNQLKAVLNRLRTVTGKETEEYLEELKLEQEYIDSVMTFLMHIRKPTSQIVDQLHENMSTTSPVLASILATHSDGDIEEIRKQYKKKYRVKLTDDLEAKCTSGEVLPILVELATKTPGAKSPVMKRAARGRPTPAKSDSGNMFPPLGRNPDTSRSTESSSRSKPPRPPKFTPRAHDESTSISADRNTMIYYRNARAPVRPKFGYIPKASRRKLEPLNSSESEATQSKLSTDKTTPANSTSKFNKFSHKKSESSSIKASTRKESDEKTRPSEKSRPIRETSDQAKHSFVNYKSNESPAVKDSSETRERASGDRRSNQAKSGSNRVNNGASQVNSEAKQAQKTRDTDSNDFDESSGHVSILDLSQFSEIEGYNTTKADNDMSREDLADNRNDKHGNTQSSDHNREPITNNETGNNDYDFDDFDFFDEAPVAEDTGRIKTSTPVKKSHGDGSRVDGKSEEAQNDNGQNNSSRPTGVSGGLGDVRVTETTESNSSKAPISEQKQDSSNEVDCSTENQSRNNEQANEPASSPDHVTSNNQPVREEDGVIQTNESRHNQSAAEGHASSNEPNQTNKQADNSLSVTETSEDKQTAESDAAPIRASLNQSRGVVVALSSANAINT